MIVISDAIFAGGAGIEGPTAGEPTTAGTYFPGQMQVANVDADTSPPGEHCPNA